MEEFTFCPLEQDGHRKQNFLVERVEAWNKVYLQPVIPAAVSLAHNGRMVVITSLTFGCRRLGCMMKCHRWWFSKFLRSRFPIVFILSANVRHLKRFAAKLGFLCLKRSSKNSASARRCTKQEERDKTLHGVCENFRSTLIKTEEWWTTEHQLIINNC